jgi:subtilase family serine protease
VEANSKSGTDLFNAILVAAGYTDANGLSTKEVSMSWGGAEFSQETSLDSYYFGAPGVVYFASTGDHGTAGGTEYPSTSPYVVAVGGTTVNTDSKGNFVSETGWSGSGGGLSSQEARPFYQDGIQSIVGNARGVPDIACEADPATGVSVYDTTAPHAGWILGGGTSLSSPMMAAMVNAASEWYLVWAGSSQRLLDTLYYNQAATGYAHYRDITSGSNGAYSCQSGWDLVTGIGTPTDFYGLTDFYQFSVSPTSASVYSSDFTLTVSGTPGYGNFDKAAVIIWNGTALPTTLVNDTELQAVVPASALTTHGYIPVAVSDAGDYAQGFFVVNAPTPLLSTLAPTSVHAGGPAFTLTVTSTLNSFVQDSTLNWNGTALTTTFVSPTQLQASVPASAIASAGTASITVVTPGPGGGTSAAQTLSIVEPNVVSGTLTLPGCVNLAQNLTFAFRPTSGASGFTRTLTLNSDGTFLLEGIPADQYTMAIKGSKWLQKVVAVDTTNGDVSGVTAMLPAGDINNDNKVNILDLGLLADAFGSTPSSDTWNDAADLNCDGKVDILDLGLLADSFGKNGDP